MPGSHLKMALISAVLGGMSSKLPLCCPILFHSPINVDIKVVLLSVVYVLVYFVPRRTLDQWSRWFEKREQSSRNK